MTEHTQNTCIYQNDTGGKDAPLPILLCSRRILLIEDNRSDALLIEHSLREHAGDRSLNLLTVPRMVDALCLLDSQSFDLVLLDLNLLDIEGTAAIAALHAEIPHTPIIVYSGAIEPKIKEDALMCGATRYLQKGYDDLSSLPFTIQETLTHTALQ